MKFLFLTSISVSYEIQQSLLQQYVPFLVRKLFFESLNVVKVGLYILLRNFMQRPALHEIIYDGLDYSSNETKQ